MKLHYFGHEVEPDPKQPAPKDNEVYGTGLRYKDTKQPALQAPKRKCPKCNEHQTNEGHDPCIAKLPGVRTACCGHGVHKGYIMFTNDVAIDGAFKRREERKK